MRWLIAIVVSFGVATPATAGVFKARGSKPGAPAAAPAKKPAVEKTAAEKPAPAKKAPAAAPAKKSAPVAKAPAKKGKGSAVASGKGRPDDLTPDPAAKKSKGGEVTIIEDVEEDVIIRDIDD